MKRSRQHLQKKTANATCFALLMLAAPSLALAQGLPDPTRPPAGFVDPAELKAGAADGQAASGQVAGALASEKGLVLQSVLLPQKGSPVAVISGQYLPLGARIDDWELKSVNEREVVLVQGRQRQVLKLTPQVRKTMVRAEAAGSPQQPARANQAKKRSKPMPIESELQR